MYREETNIYIDNIYMTGKKIPIFVIIITYQVSGKYIKKLEREGERKKT